MLSTGKVELGSVVIPGINATIGDDHGQAIGCQEIGPSILGSSSPTKTSEWGPVPFLVNAPVLLRNLLRAAMPCFVPRISGIYMELETLWRIWQ